MDIELLRLRLHEQDLNRLVRIWGPNDHPIEELAIRLSPEGIHVSGEYPFFMNVPFETVWKVHARDGNLATELLRYKALGISGNIFRSAIMKLIADSAKQYPWLSLQGDLLFVDVAQAVSAETVPTRIRISHVTIEPPYLILSAGME